MFQVNETCSKTWFFMRWVLCIVSFYLRPNKSHTCYLLWLSKTVTQILSDIIIPSPPVTPDTGDTHGYQIAGIKIIKQNKTLGTLPRAFSTVDNFSQCHTTYFCLFSPLNTQDFQHPMVSFSYSAQFCSMPHAIFLLCSMPH